MSRGSDSERVDVLRYDHDGAPYYRTVPAGRGDEMAGDGGGGTDQAFLRTARWGLSTFVALYALVSDRLLLGVVAVAAVVVATKLFEDDGEPGATVVERDVTRERAAEYLDGGPISDRPEPSDGRRRSRTSEDERGADETPERDRATELETE